MKHLSKIQRVFVISLLASTGALAHAAETTLGQQLKLWNAQSGRPGDSSRGEAFFRTKHGGEWSCSSCHGAPPTAPGKHATTGKSIPPLAPVFNARAFTDSARTDKWFRRNCKDVLGRECSPAEKADVLAYLESLR